MKKVWMIVLSLICVLSFAAACARKGNDGALDADNDKDFQFEEYDYTNPEHTTSDWRDLPVDEGMTIDGAFDESVYEGQKEFKFTAGLNGVYGLSLTTYFSDMGAYFKVAVTDPGVFYDVGEEIYENSSVILYVSPYTAGETPVKGVNTVQLRVGANGQTEQWFGRKSEDGYAYVRGYVPMMARTRIFNRAGEAETFDRLGEVNFSETSGYNAEIFMPWKSIGLSEKPEHLLVLPEFNKKMTFADEGRTMYQAPGCDYINPATFKVFDANGLSSTLGRGANMNGALGYDLSNDTAAPDRSIEQTGTGDQKLFFNDLNATKYYIEAEVAAKSVLNGDSFPKFGLLAAENSGNTLAFFVDPFASLTNKDVLAVGRNTANSDWVWNGAKLANLADMSYTNGTPVKLGVARDGAKFYFMVNGALVGVRENVRGFDAGTPSTAGFMTMNLNAVYTNYRATADSAEVDTILTERKYVKFVAPAKTSYLLNDSLDLTGGKLIVDNYKGTAREEIALTAQGVEVSGFDGTQQGAQTITVTYEGKSYRFDVLVSRLLVDGDLSDWESKETTVVGNLASVVGTETTVGKEVKFYAKLTEEGLYVAAIAKHELYKNTNAAWFENTNFEFFVMGGNQYYITEKEVSSNITLGVMKTTDSGTAGPARYTTVAEGFIQKSKLPSYFGSEIQVGFAWKTAGDKISGGAANGGGLDEYWVPKGSWPNNGSQLYVTENGIFTTSQIAHSEIALDGSLSEWTADMKRNPVAVFGNGEFTSQGFTTYAYYKRGTGLFVGVEAKHKTNPKNGNEWWQNTNLEFYVNGGEQCYVNSKGQVVGVNKNYVKMVTTGADGGYTTVVEMFIPQSTIWNASGDYVRFGFAFKVAGESITIPDRDGGNATDWWWQDKHHPSNKTEQYFVRADGIHTA